MMELIPGLIDDIGLECLVKVPYKDFSSVHAVCQSWKLHMELPEFWLRRKQAGVTQQIIVMTQAIQASGIHKKPESYKHLASPTYRLVVLEPESGKWSELPQVPEYLDGLPMFCQLVGVGLNLVVVGGWNPMTWEVTNAVFVYNFVSGKWRRGADLPGRKRSFFACSSDSDKMVFVAGGHDDEKTAMRSALAYDVAKDEWTTLPDMARDRDECKGVFHRGKFHVIGGYHTNMQGRFDNSAEAFDVSNWRWDDVQDQFMATAMCPRTCVEGGDGRLYICRDGAVVAVESSTWDIVAELPTDVRITSYVTSFLGNLLVVGSTGFNEPQRCWTFNLGSRKWTKMAVAEGFTGHVQSGCCLEM